jgi:hypothetical protein
VIVGLSLARCPSSSATRDEGVRTPFPYVYFLMLLVQHLVLLA